MCTDTDYDDDDNNDNVVYVLTQYLTVAKDIFNFMNKYFVMCNSNFVLDRVTASISEIDVIVLAALIRDLDSETGMFYIMILLNFIYSLYYSLI